jgi:hypothetical protein
MNHFLFRCVLGILGFFKHFHDLISLDFFVLITC